MLKILQTSTSGGRLALLLLAVAVVLPCEAGTATLSTLYNFTDLSDGSFPEAGLVLSSSGVLYGTTSSGGSGWGTVFELIPGSGGASWTEKTLYEFTGGVDGANPVADLIIGKNNILYGTTYYGGAHGYGTAFQLSQVTGGAWQEKVLYSFAGGNDGAYPAAGLTYLAKNGVLYGSTYGGGSANLGTVFELIPSQSGWTEQVLHTFVGGTDGANPVSDLALASNNSLFGTTSQGGQYVVTNQPPTCTQTAPCTVDAQGIAFELTPMGGGVFNESILYTFTGGTDGGSPESALIIGANNNVLYGTTFWGGIGTACPIGEYPQGCGTIYELTTTGSGQPWTETLLYSFSGHNPDGAHPYGNMGLNASGDLFGTTSSGGANVDTCNSDAYNGCGSIFEVKPPAQQGGKWTKSNLTVFPGSPGGGTPNGLIIAKGGTMYGTTYVGGNSGGYGTVFQMTP